MFFNAGVSFATFSLLTRYLNEVDYGIISLYSSISILLVAFISAGVQFVLNVDYFSMKGERYKNQFSNGIIIPVAIALFLTLGFLVFNRPLQPFIKSNFFFIVILPFSCLLTFFNDITLGLIRNKERHFLFAGYSIGKNLIEISLVISFVVVLGWNWQGRLSGALIALACTIAFSFYLFRRWDLLTGKFDTERIKAIVREGLPFIPERLAVFFMMYSDRFFIDHFEGVGDVGYYSAGAQIAVILNLICHSLNSTFYPYFYKRLGKEELDYPGLRKGIYAFTGISAATMIFLFVATPFVFKYFVGSTFGPGEKYAYYLIVGFFFWAIYNMLLPFLLIRKKNRMVMSISIVGMLLSIGLNFYNVRHFGALGATYTSIAVFFSMCLMTLYFVHRNYNLKLIFRGK
jgi:O-antigen/teichoic acid export membrane protein